MTQGPLPSPPGGPPVTAAASRGGRGRPGFGVRRAETLQTTGALRGALWRAGRGVAGAGADQGQALRGRPRSLPIDFCLRIVPRGRPRHGPLGLPGTVGVITAIPWRSYTDCNRRAGVRRASGPALPQWPGPEGDTDARAVGACHVSVRLRPEHWLGLPAPENGCGPRPWTDVSSSCGAEIWAPCQDRVRSVTRNHEDGRRHACGALPSSA